MTKKKSNNVIPIITNVQISYKSKKLNMQIKPIFLPIYVVILLQTIKQWPPPESTNPLLPLLLIPSGVTMCF